MAKNKIVTTYMGVDYPHIKAGKVELKEKHPDVYAKVFNDKKK